MSKRYIYFGCDDPYRMLATNILTNYTLDQVAGMILSPGYVVEVAKDNITDSIDYSGIFADCIVDNLMSSGKIRWAALQKVVAEEMVKNLDVPRLQKELRDIVVELGLASKLDLK